MQNFWDIIWIIVCIHVLAVYLMVLFHFLRDLFKDVGLSGWLKAIWIVALIFAPLLTAVIYLITRSRGVAESNVTPPGRTDECTWPPSSTG